MDLFAVQVALAQTRWQATTTPFPHNPLPFEHKALKTRSNMGHSGDGHAAA